MEYSDLDRFGRFRPDQRGDTGEYQASGDGKEVQNSAFVHGSIRDYRMPDDCSAIGFQQSACHSGARWNQLDEPKRLISFQTANSYSAHRGSLLFLRFERTVLSAQVRTFTFSWVDRRPVLFCTICAIFIQGPMVACPRNLCAWKKHHEIG